MAGEGVPGAGLRAHVYSEVSPWLRLRWAPRWALREGRGDEDTLKESCLEPQPLTSLSKADAPPCACCGTRGTRSKPRW